MYLDFDQPLSKLPLVFLDLETTGLRPTQGHRICEIAMIRMCGDQIEATLEQLINPERELDTGAFLVNHISAEMLNGQPTFSLMADPILAMLQDGIIVAHNAPFDCAFLAHEYDRLGYPALINPAIDTLALARRLIHRRYYSLNSFATDLQLEAPMHRAMDDLRVLRVLFGWLATLMAARGIHTLAEVLRCQRGFMPGEPEPDPPPIIATALGQAQCLRIVYHSLRAAEPTERIIRPLYIMKRNQMLYLNAYCYLRDDIRSFALDRIRHMELA